MSQGWPSAFVIEEIRDPSAEPHRMAEEPRCRCDRAALEASPADEAPARSKALGRGVRGIDEAS